MQRTLVLACFISGFAISSAQADDISGWSLGNEETITWEDVENLRKQIFETFDSDGNGALDNEEYDRFDKARIAAAKKQPSSLMLRAVSEFSRSNLDQNFDGLVTREEMEADLRKWFTRTDKNNDGILIKGEI